MTNSLYLRLLTYVKPYWKMFTAGILSMVVLAASETAVAAMLKPLLDGSFVEKDPDFMFWMPFIMVAVFAVRGISTFTSTMAFAWVGNKVVLELRKKMFSILLLLPTSYYDKNATGNIISKLTYNVTQVTEAATSSLTVLVKDTLTVIGLLGWMFYLNWKLSLTTLAILPVMMLVILLTGKRMRRLNRNLQSTIGDMTHVLEESVKGQKVVKIFGGQQYEANRFGSVANWVRRFQMKIKAAASINVIFVEGVGAICFAIIIYVGTKQAAADAISVGGFVSFFTAMGLLFAPIKRLTKVNELMQKGLAASETIFALIDEPAENDLGHQKLEKPKGQVTFKNVSLKFPQADRNALESINLEIKPGETVALVGPSGGGKTTLASLLPRLYSPDSGTIFFDEKDIQQLKLDNLRQNISFVGQDVILFNDTIAANIAYGIEPVPEFSRIQQAADKAYVSEFANKLPDGLYAEIGENGVLLSGGQRQRIAIARAFLKKAPLLILDEATSALDTASERHVQEAINALESSCTTLVIAHRLSTVENADRIFVLAQGKITEQGTHQELIALNGIYADLYNTQFH